MKPQRASPMWSTHRPPSPCGSILFQLSTSHRAPSTSSLAAPRAGSGSSSAYRPPHRGRLGHRRRRHRRHHHRRHRHRHRHRPSAQWAKRSTRRSGGPAHSSGSRHSSDLELSSMAPTMQSVAIGGARRCSARPQPRRGRRVASCVAATDASVAVPSRCCCCSRPRPPPPALSRTRRALAALAMARVRRTSPRSARPPRPRLSSPRCIHGPFRRPLGRPHHHRRHRRHRQHPLPLLVARHRHFPRPRCRRRRRRRRHRHPC